MFFVFCLEKSHKFHCADWNELHCHWKSNIIPLGMRGLEKKSLMNRNKEAVYKKKGLETPTIELHKSIFIRNEIIKSSQSHPTWDSILNVSLEHSFEIRWQFFPPNTIVSSRCFDRRDYAEEKSFVWGEFR